MHRVNGVLVRTTRPYFVLSCSFRSQLLVPVLSPSCQDWPDALVSNSGAFFSASFPHFLHDTLLSPAEVRAITITITADGVSFVVSLLLLLSAAQPVLMIASFLNLPYFTLLFSPGVLLAKLITFFSFYVCPALPSRLARQQGFICSFVLKLLDW